MDEVMRVLGEVWAWIVDAVAYLRTFNPLSVTLRLVLALVLSGIIGMDRERHGRAAGLRTHILVCVGSAMTTLLGAYAVEVLGYNGDPMRVAAQVISGIGFLGVGTILTRGRGHVTGLTTAAGLWSTATIGLACGIGFYEGALICSAVVFVAIALMSKYDNKMKLRLQSACIYVEVDDPKQIGPVDELLREKYKAVEVHIVQPRSTIPGNTGIEIALPVKSGADLTEIRKELSQHEGVLYTQLS